VIDSSLHAAGLVRTGELEHAGVVAREAIEASGTLRSFRASQSLAALMAELLPHRQVAAVDDVFEYARTAAPVTPVMPSATGRN
jgi:hypothetical protein